MLKLPYKTAPAQSEKVVVGNPQIGELEIPKLGDLSPNERLFIKSQNIPDLRQLAVSLAKEISEQSQMRMLDVYDALTTGDAETLGESLESFIKFQQQMEEVSRDKSIVMATAVIKMRICPEWTMEDTGNPEAIHPLLIKEVAEFARKEESGWVEEVEAEPVTEEDLGNSVNQANPIGEKSTGESSDIGEQTADSVATISDSSQPGS